MFYLGVLGVIGGDRQNGDGTPDLAYVPRAVQQQQ